MTVLRGRRKLSRTEIAEKMSRQMQVRRGDEKIYTKIFQGDRKSINVESPKRSEEEMSKKKKKGREKKIRNIKIHLSINIIQF